MWSNSIEAIKESMLIETTSPIDAANGVAKLSGFKWNFSDNNITATNTKSAKKKNYLLIVIKNTKSRKLA